MANQQLKEGALAVPLNVSDTTFRALQTKMCTYHELNTCIGLEGVMNIIEVEQVAKYNHEKLKYYAEQDK